MIPFAPEVYVADLNIALLWFLAMSSLAVYGVLLGGFASNNKYALLGSLRAAAQMVTYEVFMGLSIMGVVIHAGSFSLVDIVEAQKDLWFIVPQFLGFVIFFIAGLAESHRLPFDLPEAEHELTAGFHTEYSGMKFVLLMCGEYVAVIVTSCLLVLLFFGGWLVPDFLDFLPPIVWFGTKVLVFIHIFVLAARGDSPAPLRPVDEPRLEDPPAAHSGEPAGHGLLRPLGVLRVLERRQLFAIGLRTHRRGGAIAPEGAHPRPCRSFAWGDTVGDGLVPIPRPRQPRGSAQGRPQGSPLRS